MSIHFHRLGDMWKQRVAWSSTANTDIALSREHPLAETNTVALKLTAQAGGGGIINSGFWGIPAADGDSYALSFFAANLGKTPLQVHPAPSGLLIQSSALPVEQQAGCLGSIRIWIY